MKELIRKRIVELEYKRAYLKEKKVGENNSKDLIDINWEIGSISKLIALNKMIIGIQND